MRFLCSSLLLLPADDRRQTQDGEAAALRAENVRLTEELREARAMIRTLELQVETVKANARKAAALLEG